MAIDDISDQFSNLKDSLNPDLFLDFYEVTSSDKYTNLLIRVDLPHPDLP